MNKIEHVVQKNGLLLLMDKSIKKEQWVEVVELARKLDELDRRAVELGVRKPKGELRCLLPSSPKLKKLVMIAPA